MNNPQGEAKLHFLDYWRVLRIRWPFVFLIFLLVVIIAGVVTYVSPREFVGHSTVEVRRDDFFMQIFGGRSGPGRSDPRFLITQFEIMQRKEVLYPVIEKLNLVERWRDVYGTSTIQGAFSRLKRNLDVREIRNTDLIQISVYSLNPEEAAEIANEVAEQYRLVRIGQVEEWVSRSLSTLQAEVDKLAQQTDELRTEAARIRAEHGIVDLYPDTVEHAGQMAETLLIDVEQQVSRERREVEALRARYAQIQDLNDETIMRSARTLNIDDPIIMQIWPEYQQAVAEEVRLLNAGLGANHPTIRSLRAKKEERYGQLVEQVRAYRASLESSLAIAESRLDALDRSLTGARGEQEDSRLVAVEYTEAKNRYIQSKRLLEAAQVRLSSEALQLTMPQSPAIVWEQAEPINSPVRPNILLNMLIGIVGGLVLGIGAAFFMEYLDTSVKTLEEVESELGMPVLAIIPKNIRILPRESGDCPDAEAYRILRTNIEFNRKSPDANTFTVISGGAGEGKSTTIANLAHASATGGYNTLVVDADLRRPTQHRVFGVSNDRGLSDYLTGAEQFDNVVIPTSTPNLFLVASGKQPSDAVGVLNSQRMDELVGEAKSRFDVVFFDSPPILGVSDASILCSAVDLVVMVVQHRRFPKSMLLRVRQAVENVGGNILGVVLNNVDTRHDSQYEYYTSYYNYYAKPAAEPKAGAKKAGATASGNLVARSDRGGETEY